jgi:anti-anti-sigma regulatory factor
MFGKLKISAKIGILIGASLLLMTAMYVVTFVGVNRIGEEILEMADENMPLSILIGEVESAVATQVHDAEVMLHYADVELAKQTGSSHYTDTDWRREMSEVKESFALQHEIVTQNLEEVRGMLHREGAALHEMAKVRASLAEIEDNYGQYKLEMDATIVAIDAGNYEGALSEQHEIERHEADLDHVLHETVDVFEGFMKASAAAAYEEHEATDSNAALLLGLCAVVAIVFGFFIVRSVTTPLVGAIDIANRIADGDRDIEIEVTTTDETGQLLSAMRDMLGAISEAEVLQKESYAAQQKAFEDMKRQQAELEQANEDIKAQTETIQQLTTPLVTLAEGIVMMPLIGVLDTQRSAMMSERLLTAITEQGATIGILDVTGVPTIDTSVARHLMSAVDAAAVLGAEVIITGFSPEAAQTLAQLGVDIDRLRTRGSLQAGLGDAFARTGRHIAQNAA